MFSWSGQRLALAVLDAHPGRSLSPGEVVAFVAERASEHRLDEGARKFQRKGSAIVVGSDGRWSMAPEAPGAEGAKDALRATRGAVRARIAALRRRASLRDTPSVTEARVKASERRRAAHAEELAALSRALLVAFPPKHPRAVALLDVGRHSIETFIDAELDALRARVAAYDLIGAQEVRPLLRALEIDAAGKRLAELGPPQKTKKITRGGRTLKVTSALLVRGSCGIGRPFGDPKKLAAYLGAGELTKLRRRLEADIKSLYALYQYGRLHRAVRLRWGFLDEMISVPWVHHDEPSLADIKRAALDAGARLEVVVGSAPGWGEPWSRGRVAFVVPGRFPRATQLVDEAGQPIDEAEIQSARLA